MMEMLALKSFALLGVAWAMVAGMRARSAAMRHLIWTMAFGGLLALPVLSMVLPTVRVPVRGALALPGVVFQSEVVGSGLQVAGEKSTLNGQHNSPGRALKWRLAMLWIWASGTVLSVGQMLKSWAGMERVRRGARMLATAEHGMQMRETNAGTMPMSYGIFRPVILIPEDAREWNTERRRMVVRHELAHVRRRDGARQLVARLALSLYWWNPLAWLGWREFLKERERAADDLVLNLGERATEYAGHLLEIARSMRADKARWPAVAMAAQSQLEGRLVAILDTKRDRKVPQRSFTTGAVIAAIGMVLPLAAMQVKPSAAPQSHQVGDSGFEVNWLKDGDEAREHGRNEEARRDYDNAQKALTNGPEQATLFLHRGTVELALKDFAGAKKDFEQASGGERKGEARMWMALTEQEQGHLTEAAALFQSSLEAADPHFATTVIELYAGLLEKQGNAEEAKAMRGRAVDARNAEATAMTRPLAPDVYRSGGDVNPPVLISKVEPTYSEEARIAKYAGTTVMTVEIGADGVPRNIRALRPLGLGLSEKAAEAVGQWRFNPATRNGKPVTVAATIEINFKLL